MRVAFLFGVLFLVLAAANSGGYRYGISDQAFYIPAIDRHLDPALFPRDRVLIDEQARLFWLDDAAAWVERSAGVSLPVMFATGFAFTGLLLGAGLWWLARDLGLGPASAAAFVVAMTLRHRVAETGVNTFEGYFHPRVLAFAVGIVAIALLATGRVLLAPLLLVVAFLVHPTTAMWFAGWYAVAIIVVRAGWHLREPGATAVRRFSPAGLLITVAVAMLLLLLLLAGAGGVLDQAFVRMDSEWRSVLASKDYLFPNEWPAFAWIAHGASVTLVCVGLLWRRRAGVTSPHEVPVVVGCLALFVVFLLTLPFVAMGLALFVQLQISRVLWAIETMGTLYLVWMLAEAPVNIGARSMRPRGGGARPAVVLALVALAALGRGVFISGFEHRDRRALQLRLPDTEWVEVLDWARESTPRDSYFLADPGHAWKYAISFRVGALRDVYLEEVKDAAMAMYSRTSAMRVLERLLALGQFRELTPERLDVLVARYGLTHLVREKVNPGADLCLGHRVTWQNPRFVVCDLGPASSSAR